MKRYELKTTQSQKEIKLHNTKKFHDENKKNWTILFEMSCDGFHFNFFIDEGKMVLDFLEKENEIWEGNKEEVISYLKYIFE